MLPTCPMRDLSKRRAMSAQLSWQPACELGFRGNLDLLRQRGVTLREIGALFGGMNYTAVSQRVRRVEKSITGDKRLRRLCQLLNVLTRPFSPFSLLSKVIGFQNFDREARNDSQTGIRKDRATILQMNWKDGISLTVSLIALMISSVGSYFTFFRVSPSVSAAVLSITLSEKEFTANVAVLNTGNRQVALIDADLFVVQRDNGELLRQRQVPAPETERFPILVEPGKLALITLKAEDAWQAVVAYREEIEPGNDHSHEATAGVEISALAATGARLEGYAEAVKIELRENKFGGYSLSTATFPLKTVKHRR